jgi:hypothetical protein
MTDTVNLGLPCIEGSQAQKHVTHNDALRILDTLVQLAVLDRDLSAPPTSPAEGQRWIVKATASGAWAGHDNAIAAWQDGAWQFSAPQTGWSAFVVDEAVLLVWNGTAWSDFFSAVALQNLTLLGVGTTADSSNPLSAKLNNTLFVAKTVAEGGDGNLRYKLSKESAAKTLSFLLQDNYSGRAEIGLTGDDDFHFKVSADGSTWVEALTLNKTSGAATLASSAAATAFIPSGSSAPSNGIYLPSANTIGIAANSTQILTGTTATLAVKPTTASTSTSTGALTVGGGAGIAGALNVGAASKIAGSLAINGVSIGSFMLGVTSGTFSGVLYVEQTYVSSSGDSVPSFWVNAPNLVANSSIEFNIGQAASVNNRANIAFYYAGAGSTGNAITFGYYGNNGLMKIFATGQVSVPTAIASTSTSTGALVVGGGLGVAGKGYFGDALTATALIPSGSSVPANGIYLPAANSLGWATNTTARGKIDANGNFILGTAALATNATNGFVYIPTCAGTPTGTPTSVTGMMPMIYDSTNHKLYVYDGGWKGGTVPGAWS